MRFQMGELILLSLSIGKAVKRKENTEIVHSKVPVFGFLFLLFSNVSFIDELFLTFYCYC